MHMETRVLEANLNPGIIIFERVLLTLEVRRIEVLWD